MKKKSGIRLIYSLIILLFILISPGLSAQVDQGELENVGPVEFINYTGTYDRVETRDQIRDIGYSLGLLIRNGQTQAGASGRYFVIHSVSEADGSKLDADIFGLGVDVLVDHINSLRLIIQGYLEGAYSYSESDAALLARYITVYNAVYRGDMNYFSSRYKNPVMGNVTRERAGLSIRYDEWPGQSLILIPLGPSSAGPLSAVSTIPLVETPVTAQITQDSGLDTRRDMVDLMERQADEATQTAAVQQQAIAEQQESIAQQQQEVQQQVIQAQQELAAITQERQVTGADQAALDERQQQAEEQLAQAEEQQQQLDQQQQQLDEQSQAAAQAQQAADDLAAAAQQERGAIAGDQQAIINQEDTVGVLGASIASSGNSQGYVVRINPSSGRELRRSPLISQVNTRSLVQINNRLFAIAQESSSGAVRLVEFNPETLEMINQGNDDMSPDSLIWVNGNEFYAIVSTGGNYYLGRFNTDLVQQSRSSVTVHPFASIMLLGDYIATQRADGTAVLLNPSDLTERRN